MQGLTSLQLQQDAFCALPLNKPGWKVLFVKGLCHVCSITRASEGVCHVAARSAFSVSPAFSLFLRRGFHTLLFFPRRCWVLSNLTNSKTHTRQFGVFWSPSRLWVWMSHLFTAFYPSDLQAPAKFFHSFPGKIESLLTCTITCNWAGEKWPAGTASGSKNVVPTAESIAEAKRGRAWKQESSEESRPSSGSG